MGAPSANKRVKVARAYEDFYQYTLKLTEASQAGLEEVAWRASSISRPRPTWRANCAVGPPNVAYWYGAQQHLLDIADIFAERDVRIETGPAKHGTTQADFLYCFEPGDTGYLIFDSDWKTIVWDVANEVDLEKSSIWFGSQLAKTFYRYGTPVVPGHSLEEIGR